MKTWNKSDRCTALIAIFLILPYLLQSTILTAQAQGTSPVVRAVLFYSPTCGHCQHVIHQTILPLIEQYGDQFQVIGVDTSQPQGQALFESALNLFNPDFAGVPFLVIGNEYLIGSVDIPEKLPGMIEKHSTQGGLDWPNIPGFQDVLPTVQATQTPSPIPVLPTDTSASLSTQTPAPVILEADTPLGSAFPIPYETQNTAWQRVMLDPLGNGIAIAVLFTMITVVVGKTLVHRQIPNNQMFQSPQILIPVLCLIGLIIAGYLACVETTQTTAVCGPVGDCNTVQQSEYARLFGILPIGVLGVFGYLSIFFSWCVAKTRHGRIADLAKLSMSILSTIGVLFSIYLTFLEPFVIGATCVWCLASAIISTILFFLASREARTALSELSR